MEESSQIYEDNLARAEQNAVDKIIAAVAENRRSMDNPDYLGGARRVSAADGR